VVVRILYSLFAGFLLIGVLSVVALLVLQQLADTPPPMEPYIEDIHALQVERIRAEKEGREADVQRLNEQIAALCKQAGKELEDHRNRS
jgi:hypothetical protein